VADFGGDAAFERTKSGSTARFSEAKFSDIPGSARRSSAAASGSKWRYTTDACSIRLSMVCTGALMSLIPREAQTRHSGAGNLSLRAFSRQGCYCHLG
jgi:hypothetical protein